MGGEVQRQATASYNNANDDAALLLGGIAWKVAINYILSMYSTLGRPNQQLPSGHTLTLYVFDG